jgi:hypothetical protein
MKRGIGLLNLIEKQLVQSIVSSKSLFGGGGGRGNIDEQQNKCFLWNIILSMVIIRKHRCHHLTPVRISVPLLTSHFIQLFAIGSGAKL